MNPGGTHIFLHFDNCSGNMVQESNLVYLLESGTGPMYRSLFLAPGIYSTLHYLGKLYFTFIQYHIFNISGEGK